MDKVDIQDFRQLLQKEEMFQKSRKSFLYEGKNDYIKLLSYRIMISDQYLFQNRVKYLSPVEDFLEGKIIESDFLNDFDVSYWCEDSPKMKDFEKDLEQLEKLCIDSKSKGFSELIKQIDKLCDFVDPQIDYLYNEEIYEFDFDEINEINEINKSAIFLKEIQEIYVVMKRFD